MPFTITTSDDEFREIVQEQYGRFNNDVEVRTAYEAICYVEENQIPGDVIECGVLCGDKPALWCRYLRKHGRVRDVYLYDTFNGMTAPDIQWDYKLNGTLNGQQTYAKYTTLFQDGGWGRVGLPEVRARMQTTGYRPDHVFYVEGPVRETVPVNAHRHERIAILRWDIAWYAETRVGLEHLYRRIVPGGLLILDDYGAWAGQRKAVDEFMDGQNVQTFNTSRKERVYVKEM